MNEKKPAKAGFFFCVLNFDLSVGLLCSFLARVGKKRTKETPLKGKRVLIEKKRTCRIFSLCDILSPLRIPLTCPTERTTRFFLVG